MIGSVTKDQLPNADEIVGLAKSLVVMPGDTVHITAYGKYFTPTSTNSNAATMMLASMAQAFGVSALSTGEALTAYNRLDEMFGSGFFLGSEDWEDEDAPKAFLNYILFDKNFVPYDMGWDQIDESALSTHDELELTAPVTQPGYIYIYLSNENEKLVDVYFDDLTIQHKIGPVVQQDEYYAFGLTFNSYQRENSLKNKLVKFQGQEHIDDLDLGWDSFKWRNHMPDIGRFFNVDPLSEKYYYNSVYAFSENKVVAHVELEGLESFSINTLTNGEFSKYENMAKPILNDPKPEAPPTSGDKVLNGISNVALGLVGAISSGAFVVGTEGVGAALGGGTAFSLSLGEIAIGFAQIVDGASEMGGGNSDKSGVLQNSSSLPGLVANATGSENAQLIDAAGQLIPGMLTGGNMKTILQSPSTISSSKNGAEAALNVLNTLDAALDVKEIVKATVNTIKSKTSTTTTTTTNDSTQKSKEEIKAIANYVDSLN